MFASLIWTKCTLRLDYCRLVIEIHQFGAIGLHLIVLFLGSPLLICKAKVGTSRLRGLRVTPNVSLVPGHPGQYIIHEEMMACQGVWIVQI